MTSVIQLAKQLKAKPEVLLSPSFAVRSYAGEDDIHGWLNLRNLAFARELTGVRKWSKSDFVTEFLQRRWWNSDRMWLVESESNDSSTTTDNKTLVGSVTLAMRGESQHAVPVVHWLIVHPRWRRRGIGRVLMSHLEVATWDAGYRELRLETHSAWKAANRFYEALGYQAV